MLSVNRKLIEEYYETEWSELLSMDTRNHLVELTCKSYHLNQPRVPDFVKSDEPQGPKRLGEL